MPRPLPFKHREPKHARAWLRDSERRRERQRDITVVLILITVAAFIALIVT